MNTPVLGTRFSVSVAASNGDCSYLCNQWWLLTGFSRSSGSGVPLPLPLGCGELLVSPDLIQGVPFGSGDLLMTLQIPANPGLVGLSFHQQAVAVTYIFGGVNAVAPGHGGTGVIGN